MLHGRSEILEAEFLLELTEFERLGQNIDNDTSSSTYPRPPSSSNVVFKKKEPIFIHPPIVCKIQHRLGLDRELTK